MGDLQPQTRENNRTVERHPLREWLCELLDHDGVNEQWAVSEGPNLTIRTLVQRRCGRGHLLYLRPDLATPVDPKDSSE